MSMRFVLEEVAQERARQDFKWGQQDHTQMIWLGILAEEFGEAAKDINDFHFRPGHSEPQTSVGFQIEPCLTINQQQIRIREELIQTAAVAVAMIESLDRNGR